MCMRPLIKYFLWISCLALGLQSASAFSLLGPVAIGNDAYQVTLIGYNPMGGFGPPFFADPLAVGPKNQGEGYRRNTAVMYYTFDPSYGNYFGSNGEFAVQQAFDIFNNLTNVDSYSAGLSEFPLNSLSENFQANALGLLDMKSATMSMLMEQLGLADAVRYTWALHDRYTPPGATCTPPGPGNGLEYTVVQRNLDIITSPLNQIQYSAFVNGELYSYFLDENCGAPGGSPPNVDALEIPVDPLNNNPPVASGFGEDAILTGFFYTGLTRDDVAGLRWLYSTNNFDTPSPGYRESPATGSLLFSTNFNAPQLFYTSNLNALVSASLTNNPTTLQALFPGLSFDPNPPSYFTNQVSMNVTGYFTNPIGFSGPVFVTVTSYVTNFIQIFQYSFGNVVTNKSYPTTSYAVQTITVGPAIGWPQGFFATNVTYQLFQSNIVSGDFFIITNGTCGPNFIQTLQTNVNIVTNSLVGVTNTDGQSFVQNLISYFTNYVFVVQPCTLVTNAADDYQGLGRIQFVHVRDDNYNYLTGLFIQPVTNQYTMVVITNGLPVTRTFQRVVTAPDFLFAAADLASGPSAIPLTTSFGRNINFNQTNIRPGLAGPGTIDSPTTVTYDKVGPVYENISPFTLTGPNSASARSFIWGSFDGTTNAPVVYPNGTSIANLAASSLVQISPPPPTLPNGTHGVAYNVALSVVSGGQPPYSWMVTTNSAALPTGSPNLTVSPSGVISGTPTNSATYGNIVIQMTDSSVPPRVVKTIYSLTIN